MSTSFLDIEMTSMDSLVILKHFDTRMPSLASSKCVHEPPFNWCLMKCEPFSLSMQWNAMQWFELFLRWNIAHHTYWNWKALGAWRMIPYCIYWYLRLWCGILEIGRLQNETEIDYYVFVEDLIVFSLKSRCTAFMCVYAKLGFVKQTKKIIRKMSNGFLWDMTQH